MACKRLLTSLPSRNILDPLCNANLLARQNRTQCDARKIAFAMETNEYDVPRAIVLETLRAIYPNTATASVLNAASWPLQHCNAVAEYVLGSSAGTWSEWLAKHWICDRLPSSAARRIWVYKADAHMDKHVHTHTGARTGVYASTNVKPLLPNSIFQRR